MAIPDRSRFEEAYEPHSTTPGAWDIARPQSVILQIAEQITGRLLDSGCGSGENALFLAARGLDVVGIDFIEGAIRQAKERATGRGLTATFLVKDALTLQQWDEQFDTVLDSAVFHVFSDEDMTIYAAGLAHILKSGGKLFLIVFSDSEPGENGPRRISKQMIYDHFDDRWTIESIEESRYEVIPQSAHLFSAGGPKAWLAVIRRV